MLLKVFPVLFLFALLPVSYAHTGVAPALGVNGTLQRSDVKRPSKNQPCGDGVDIASALDTSTSVPADQKGDVNVTVTDFNAGPDGSREVTAQIDPTGTGKHFVKMAVLVNGDPSPTSKGSQRVIAQLPSGIQCTGGSKKNKCLVQFITTEGFGNCVVVSQDGNVSKRSEVENRDPKKKHHKKKGKKTKEEARAASPDIDLDFSDEGLVESRDPKKKHHHKKGKKAKKDIIANRSDPSTLTDTLGANPDVDLDVSNRAAEKGDSKKKHHHKKKGRKTKKDTISNRAEGDGDKSDGKKGRKKDLKIKKHGKKNNKTNNKKQTGTRAPRALLANRDPMIHEVIDNDTVE